MVRHWLLALAALLFLAGIGRILFLLLWRRPIQARTGDTDLTEMQRHRDRDMRWVAHFDNLPTSDDIPVRGVLARAAYVVDGIEYRADVCLITRKGDRAEMMPVIWYNPADPSRATGLGIGSAVALLAAASGLATLATSWPA